MGVRAFADVDMQHLGSHSGSAPGRVLQADILAFREAAAVHTLSDQMNWHNKQSP